MLAMEEEFFLKQRRMGAISTDADTPTISPTLALLRLPRRNFALRAGNTSKFSNTGCVYTRLLPEAVYLSTVYPVNYVCASVCLAGSLSLSSSCLPRSPGHSHAPPPASSICLSQLGHFSFFLALLPTDVHWPFACHRPIMFVAVYLDLSVCQFLSVRLFVSMSVDLFTHYLST